MWHHDLNTGARSEALTHGARCARLNCFQPDGLAERGQEAPGADKDKLVVVAFSSGQ